MIKKELYEKTVNILVDAYFNDTLEHMKCSACAVGNIIAANNGYKIDIDRPFTWDNGEVIVKWDNVFVTNMCYQTFFEGEYKGDAKLQIDSTGYTVFELAKIEYAFESVEWSNIYDEWMFNGLLAVIDALDLIHQNTDSNVTASTKQRFVKL